MGYGGAWVGAWLGSLLKKIYKNLKKIHMATNPNPIPHSLSLP
ncbi:hypothetical protein HanHA300_Chr09g0324081 [Helianthus annuus]|nr:hypothetical protein HanHA300_Chr09g0324081 [Helianthus annuus]KAJ0542909.1 hypothetical protein HanHA89_Chr09g0344991 [Helianthus annuus]KAJ0707964.1 hypothetical protein HanLR1_Chr09g0324321 [Helianthus annuus]KAJ0711936.1 hypothetical protein HanOQP8_Chr09g0329401 [Helianthus annuus]